MYLKNKNMYKHKNKAFSYIEIIISFAIFLIISFIFFSSVLVISKNQQVLVKHYNQKKYINRVFDYIANEISQSEKVETFYLKNFIFYMHLKNKKKSDTEPNNLLELTLKNKKTTYWIYKEQDDSLHCIYYDKNNQLTSTDFLKDVKLEFKKIDKFLLIKLYDKRSKKVYERIYKVN